MKVLLLGAGLQGKAALLDLVAHSGAQITVADANPASLAAVTAGLDAARVTAVPLDATNETDLANRVAGADVVIDLLPTPFHDAVAGTAVAGKSHYVNASYATPAMAAMSAEAAAQGVTLLPEFGLDPGIDLVLAGQMLAELDEIHEFHSYGAGIPEPAAADNPIRYKISWTFDGVLKAYRREAEWVRDGRSHTIPGSDIFAPAYMHLIEVEGLGELEAYPNGRVSPFLQKMGIAGAIQHAGRYSARWPGHTAFWGKLSALGLLDEAPVLVDGTAVIPRHFLRELLAPRLQYAAGERDVAFIRLDARGVKDGRARRVVYDVVDVRDLDSGLLAMQRTVGFTASIGAQMLLNGDIGKRGLLSPITDVPAAQVLAELEKRGILVKKTVNS
ncbi:MAG: saccharopine dehydrogenase family protein [Anaerolineae bacterium]